MSCPLSPAALVVAHDVTEARRLQAELARRELFDEETGLANAALFSDRVAAALGRSRSEGGQVGVLVVGLSALEAVDAEHPPIVLAMAPGDVGTYAEELVQVLSRPIEADEIPASAAARMPAADAVVSSCDVSEGRLVLTQQRLLLARAGGDALNIANEIWSVPLQDVHELLHYASGGDQILIPVIDNPVPRSAA
jgi:hypothetical protein